MNIGGKQCVPGEKHYMDREELAVICKDGNLINDMCGDRESYFAFNLAK